MVRFKPQAPGRAPSSALGLRCRRDATCKPQARDPTSSSILLSLLTFQLRMVTTGFGSRMVRGSYTGSAGGIL